MGKPYTVHVDRYCTIHPTPTANRHLHRPPPVSPARTGTAPAERRTARPNVPTQPVPNYGGVHHTMSKKVASVIEDRRMLLNGTVEPWQVIKNRKNLKQTMVNNIIRKKTEQVCCVGIINKYVGRTHKHTWGSMFSRRHVMGQAPAASIELGVEVINPHTRP